MSLTTRTLLHDQHGGEIDHIGHAKMVLDIHLLLQE